MLAFAVVAAITLLVGGSVYFDVFGTACLFLVGGVLGIILLAIHNHGRRKGGDSDVPPFP